MHETLVNCNSLRKWDIRQLFLAEFKRNMNDVPASTFFESNFVGLCVF